MSIFDRRVAYKPYEYPEVIEYADAIGDSYWRVSHWSFLSDLHDFRVKLNDAERSAIKNAMLAISQIEVSVKRFWAELGQRFPKPEFEEVGITFAESENRHGRAYSHLLEVLGLNREFDQLLQNPVIQGRVDYLTKYLKGAADNSNQNFTLTLTLFSLFIENISLFSQFLVIQSFHKQTTWLKNIDNVVQATAKEERLHALFGVILVRTIKEENPEWFNDEFYLKLERASRKAYQAEEAIIDWIFEAGDLSFLTRATVKEFTKQRFNESLAMIGGRAIFEVDQAMLAPLDWFEQEVHTVTNTDVFHKRPISYASGMQSCTEEDLF